MAFFGDLRICGTVRNAEASLKSSLRVVENFFLRAKKSSTYIVTNDNSDATESILISWVGARTDRRVINLDGLVSAYPAREDRLAIARNFYLREALQEPVEKDTILLVLDLDGPNANLDVEEAIEAIRAFDRPWSAVFANQRQAYYDLFPLRHPLWCPQDCWEDVDKASAFPFSVRRRTRAIQRLVHGRQYKIPPELAAIEVDSAFGGLGFYKAKELIGCWYGSRDERGKFRCDHLMLHKAMRARGSKLFILPSLLNDAPAEHLGIGSGSPFPYKGAQTDALPNSR